MTTETDIQKYKTYVVIGSNCEALYATKFKLLSAQNRPA